MPNRFSAYASAGFADAVIPILPPDALLSEHSTVDPKQRGKIPGVYNPITGRWSGMTGWTQLVITPEHIKLWDSWPQCNVGLRAEDFQALDLDIDDIPALVRKITEATGEYLQRAITEIRGRDGSSRCLIPFRLKLREGETAPGKVRITFTYGDKSYAVELLGKGQQYLVEGIHPSGKPYRWMMDNDLTEVGAKGLPEVTAGQLQWLPNVIDTVLKDFGCIVSGSQLSGASGGGADVRNPGELGAADLDELARALRTIPIEGMPYDRYISITHAAKAAAAGDAAFFRDVFLPWSLQYPGAQPEWVTAKWDSVGNSNIGSEWLYGVARSHGFTGGADAFSTDGVDDFDAGEGGASNPNMPGEWTDGALRNRFVLARPDDIRYCPETKDFYLWNGKAWAVDPGGNTLAGDVQEFCAIEATTAARTGHASKSDRVANAGALRGVMQVLQSTRPQTGMETLPRIAVKRADFNREKYSLNVQNGTLDLRTGIMFEHNRADLCTLTAPIEIADRADCPIFLDWIDKTFAGNASLIHYLQVAIGYTLVAERKAQLIFFIYGPTGTGKSTFTRICQRVMGAYCGTLPIDSFLKSRSAKHPADLAYVADKRMVITSESPEGSEFDVARLKMISGEETVSARFMHEGYFEYRPDFVLWCASNHKPHLPSADSAFRRRLRLIPFMHQPAQPDFTLEPRIYANELPGILRWMADGAQEYLATGFPPCPEIEALTDEYFHEEDRLGNFIADRCVKDDTAVVPFAELYRAWRTWNENNGYKFYKPAQAFGSELAERGHASVKAGKPRAWHRKGLRLKPDLWDEGAEDGDEPQTP